MLTIQMTTSEVLLLLKIHRENHIIEFEKQLNGWKKLMEQFSIDLTEWANNANEKGLNELKRPNEPEKPVNYLITYDSMIEMIEHHEQELISVDEDEFNKIVNDQFFWRHKFLSNSAIYTTHG